MEDINKDAGPNRPMRVDVSQPDYEHDFDRKEICKRCGSLSWTKGNLCTGKKLVR